MQLTKKMLETIEDPGCHFFLKLIIQEGSQKDIIDVINDLDCALSLFEDEYEKMTAEAGGGVNDNP